ncbi:MAG: hypothetical protein GX868_05185 [Actinobacteria bacterium]|nr:hypothetical protein [Actinomycetota bacterium]
MAANSGATHSGSVESRWALALTVTEEIVNAAAAFRVGEGISAGAVTQKVNLPMMGELEVSLDLSIIAVTVTMSPEHNGRLHTAVRATGEVSFGAGSPMPALPGKPVVRADVLVPVRVELRPDGRFIAMLDLANAEVDALTLEAIEGANIDPDTLHAMGSMLFGSIGPDLFSGLTASMDTIGVELDPVQARPLVHIGVRSAPADIIVGDGTLTIGLPAVDAVEGHASVALRPGQHIGAGVSAGALTQIAYRVMEDSLGVPLPFDVELEPASSEVGARIRNRRLTDSPFIPDLRPGVRTAVAARLVGERIELSPREAWVELPFVPSFVNRFNRAIGSLASLAPVSTSVPATMDVPVGDGSTVGLAVTELAMRADGVSCVIDVVL